MRLATGLLLALAAAASLNASFYVQHEAASGLPALSLRRPFGSLRVLFTNWKWFLAWLVGWVGWGLYIAALHFAPLSLTQSIVAGGLGVIALLSWRRGGVVLSSLERMGIAACLGGLVLVGISLVEHTPNTAVSDWRPIIVWVGCCVAASCLFAASPTRFLANGAGLGAAAGLLYAGGDIATKGAVSSAGVFLVPVLLVRHALGFVAMQLAFQRGSALATAGLSTLLNNTVPIAAGLVAFHETPPVDGFGVLRLVGFGAVVAGAALIARRVPDVAPVEGALPAASRSESVEPGP